VSKPLSTRTSLALALTLVTGAIALYAFYSGRSSRAEGPKTFQARGTIVSARGLCLSIAHDAIAGSMDAMTMTFCAKESATVAKLGVGDRVNFAFVQEASGGLALLRCERAEQ
jgi:Cu/Ag efflux protein CusF